MLAQTEQLSATYFITRRSKTSLLAKVMQV